MHFVVVCVEFVQSLDVRSLHESQGQGNALGREIAAKLLIQL